MIRQMIVSLCCLFFLVNGGSTEESKILHRHKRSTKCDSNDILKKYTFVTGHSACREPSPKVNLTTAGVTDAEKTEIVNKHNALRGTTAATNMMQMVWDDEIAYLAQQWAESCSSGHESSGEHRRIPGRYSLGQNLMWSSNKASWSNHIQGWFDEIRDFTYNDSNNELLKVGHYVQVVWAKASTIGCGYADCGNNHMYACDYGPGGVGSIKIPYNDGSKCQDCPGYCVGGALCNCDMRCLNGGTLDLTTCQCTCKPGYVEPDCACYCVNHTTVPTVYYNYVVLNTTTSPRITRRGSLDAVKPGLTYNLIAILVQSQDQLNCTAKTDLWWCKDRDASDCSRFSNIPVDCPHFCNLCPYAGVQYTGATDGKGGLTFDTSTITGGGGGGGNSGSDNNCKSNAVTFYGLLISLLLISRL